MIRNTSARLLPAHRCTPGARARSSLLAALIISVFTQQIRNSNGFGLISPQVEDWMTPQWVWLPAFWRNSPSGRAWTSGIWRTEDSPGKLKGGSGDICHHHILSCVYIYLYIHIAGSSLWMTCWLSWWSIGRLAASSPPWGCTRNTLAKAWTIPTSSESKAMVIQCELVYLCHAIASNFKIIPLL